MIWAPNPGDIPTHKPGFRIIVIETRYSFRERPKPQGIAPTLPLTFGQYRSPETSSAKRQRTERSLIEVAHLTHGSPAKWQFGKRSVTKSADRTFLSHEFVASLFVLTGSETYAAWPIDASYNAYQPDFAIRRHQCDFATRQRGLTRNAV